MLQINIPGFGPADIRHVVMDYNGTIARDGVLITGVGKNIQKYSDQVTFHVITADTFGSVKKQLHDVAAVLTIIPEKNQDRAKQDYVLSLGPDHTLCVGNGANDRLMLKTARIGIAVLGDEGLAACSLMNADLMIKNILDVFDYFKTPGRLVAGLRT